MATLVSGFRDFEHPSREARPFALDRELQLPGSRISPVNLSDRKHPFLLITAPQEHAYRGFPLSAHVEGARVIFTEEVLHMNPEDAKKARLEEGDKVVVTSEHFKKVWPVKLTPELSRGILQVNLLNNELIGPNPYPVRIRKSHV